MVEIRWGKERGADHRSEQWPGYGSQRRHGWTSPELRQTTFQASVHDGNRTGRKRARMQTHLSDPRQRGEDGGSVRLGGAMVDGSARLWCGDCELGWDGAAGA